MATWYSGAPLVVQGQHLGVGCLLQLCGARDPGHIVRLQAREAPLPTDHLTSPSFYLFSLKINIL